MFNKTIKNEPKFTGYSKSDEENESNWEYDVNYLWLGMTCKRKDKWIGKVKASTIEEKKILKNQKIKVKLFC